MLNLDRAGFSFYGNLLVIKLVGLMVYLFEDMIIFVADKWKCTFYEDRFVINSKMKESTYYNIDDDDSEPLYEILGEENPSSKLWTSHPLSHGLTLGLRCLDTILFLPRHCPRCNRSFSVAVPMGPDGVRVKIPKYKNGDLVTPFRNQKVCPDCKNLEKKPVGEKICMVCGKEFTPKRSDACTCGDKCRQALSRSRKKITRPPS